MSHNARGAQRKVTKNVTGFSDKGDGRLRLLPRGQNHGHEKARTRRAGVDDKGGVRLVDVAAFAALLGHGLHAKVLAAG
jgi:hypothetical protein